MAPSRYDRSCLLSAMGSVLKQPSTVFGPLASVHRRKPPPRNPPPPKPLNPPPPRSAHPPPPKPPHPPERKLPQREAPLLRAEAQLSADERSKLEDGAPQP